MPPSSVRESEDFTLLYDVITEGFRGVMTPDGKARGAAFAAAARLIAPLYDRIFGEGMVSNHLKKDIIGHATLLEKGTVMNKDFEFVQNMVPLYIKEQGIDRIRGKFGNPVVELLWTKRAIEFILRFLDYGILKMTSSPLLYSAQRAYDEVLRPYHGLVASSIVSLALRLTPSRERFLTALGFQRLEDAQAKLIPFMQVTKPVVEEIHRVLEDNNCNFPDVV